MLKMLCGKTGCELKYLTLIFVKVGRFRKHLQSGNCTHLHLPADSMMQKYLQAASSNHLHIASKGTFLHAYVSVLINVILI